MIIGLLSKLRSLKTSKQFLEMAEKYQASMGYRQEGLFFDDLIPDESPLVKEALSRLTPQERAARTLRLRVNLNLSLKKLTLDKQDWVTAEQDKRYLTPILAQIEAEQQTVMNFDMLDKVPAALLARNRAS